MDKLDTIAIESRVQEESLLDLVSKSPTNLDGENRIDLACYEQIVQYSNCSLAADHVDVNNNIRDLIDLSAKTKRVLNEENAAEQAIFTQVISHCWYSGACGDVVGNA